MLNHQKYWEYLQLCFSFEIVNKKARKLLQRIHGNLDDILKNNSFNGDIQVIVQKLSNRYRLSSWILLRIAELVNNNKCNPVWMLPVEEGNFWYKIERIHRRDLIKQQSETNDHSNTRSGNSQTDYWLQNEL